MDRIIKQIPNILTTLRFILFPFVAYFLFHNSWIAFILFAIAAITDFLDGYLARKFNCESDFGSFFDNVADKLLTISVLCTLLFLKKVYLLPVIIIVSREIMVSAFREYILKVSKSRVMVDIIGKIKTFVHFISMSILIFPADEIYFIDLNYVGNLMLSFSAFMSVWSGGRYLVKHFR